MKLSNLVLTAMTLLLTATAVYAQKPTRVAVCDRSNTGAVDMDPVRSLAVEYLKAELATRPSVKIVDSTLVKNTIDTLKASGVHFSTGEISTLCDTKDINAAVLCVVKNVHNDLTSDKNAKRYTLSVNVYTRDGKFLGTVQEPLDEIKDTDSVSKALAVKISGLIHKPAVDAGARKLGVSAPVMASADEPAKTGVK